jgi:hypothetical protein
MASAPLQGGADIGVGPRMRMETVLALEEKRRDGKCRPGVT